MQPQLRYYDHINGLRALAVLSVVLFHYGAGWLPGGFVGVDVFFVISGFLITRNIVSAIRTDRFSLAEFYSRRIRRIVPALLVVIVATAMAGWFILTPGDYKMFGDSEIYSAFGLANLFFYWHTGYFDQNAELMPLLHLWSLGVEEQFYFAWPAILMVASSVGKHHRTMAWVPVAVLTIMSLAWASHAVHANPKGAFFLPHLRAWELAAGGLLTFLPDIERRWLAELKNGIGLCAIAYSLLTLSSGNTFPGLNAVPPVVGAMLVLWPAARSTTSDLLSLPPVRFVGLVSYSLYLWHWPVLVLFRIYQNGMAPSPVQAVWLVALSFGLSCATWAFVETPVRRWSPPSGWVIAAGLTASLAVCALGALVFTSQGFPSRLSPQMAEMSSMDVMWNWTCPRGIELGGQRYCSFGAPWDQAKEHAIVWGDSHSMVLAPILEAAYANRSVGFLLVNYCPPILGSGLSAPKGDEPNYSEHCRNERAQTHALLVSHPEIDLVVLASSWARLASTIYPDVADQKKRSGIEYVISGLKQVIEAETQPSRRFVIVSSIPLLPQDPVGCELSEGSGLIRAATCADLPAATKVFYDRDQKPVRDAISNLVTHYPGVTAVFPEKALCNDVGCSLQYEGTFMYRDPDHIRRNLPETVRHSFGRAIGFTDNLLNIRSPD